MYHWRQVFIIASLAQYASTFAYVAFGSAELQVWNTPGYELQSDEPITNSRGILLLLPYLGSLSEFIVVNLKKKNLAVDGKVMDDMHDD